MRTIKQCTLSVYCQVALDVTQRTSIRAHAIIIQTCITYTVGQVTTVISNYYTGLNDIAAEMIE